LRAKEESPLSCFAFSSSLKMTPVFWALPTRSLANAREHWRVRAKTARMERTYARLSFRGLVCESPLPVHVRLVRQAPSNGLDSDNLPIALKSVRDGIADAYGVDDRDPRLVFSYGQQRGPWGVWVYLGLPFLEKEVAF
jgi:hypothetical protein